MQKVIGFQLEGDFAHFRKPFSTTSPLSFSLPPKTAISGIISGIFGWEKNSYYQKLRSPEFEISIVLKKPIKKIRLGLNLENTKKGMIGRSPTRYEFLKNVGYEIFVKTTNRELLDGLISSLKEKKFVYTPCLGLAMFLAKVKFTGSFSCSALTSDKKVEIDSVIPSSPEIPKFFSEPNLNYYVEEIPAEMDNDRQVTKFIKIVFNPLCQKIPLSSCNYYQLNSNGMERRSLNVLFF
ncbi:MAG: type I-B CRISPR-associated protein Cas5 [Candidatus Heimdallarchaeota archaeon]|nr:type I-B CRISPR-associated protein Cas5 [Candidatus Heimdallarchaeota archaeon]